MSVPITVVIGLAHGCVSCTLLGDALPHLRGPAADPTVPPPGAAQPIRPLEALLAHHECRIDTVVAGRCQLEPAGPAAGPRTSGHIAAAAGGDTPEEALQHPSPGCNARHGVHQPRRGTPAPGACRRQHRQHRTPSRDARDVTPVAGIEANPEALLVDGSEFSYRTSPTGDRDGAWRIQWRSSRPMHPQRLREALADIAEIALRGRGHVMLADRPTALERDTAGGSALCFIGVSDRWHVIHDRLRHAEVTDEEMR